MTRIACDVVVIGAGFAGAAVAHHLTRLGIRDVLIVEQEATAGVHSSGRNAAMARQTAVPGGVAPLAEEGVRFLSAPPEDFEGRSLLRACGMLVLADGDQAGALRAAAPERWIEREGVERRVPATRGGAFAGGVWGPEDGVVDIAALLHGLLSAARARGARLLVAHRVTAIRTQGGRIVEVETDRASIATRAVVNAAGAWAARLGALAGATAMPLRACRRHLFLTAPLDWVDRSWPIVWDVSHGFYFRPEPPGLLLSPCDETEHVPGIPPPDPAAAELLARKLAQFAPRLAELRPARSWAGLRVLTPDGRFVLGRDPRLEGFFWCAGLGGHGMTAGVAVGRIVAESVLGRPVPAAHDPARFVA